MRIRELLGEDISKPIMSPASGPEYRDGNYSLDMEDVVDERGPAPPALCRSKRSDASLGASQLASCKAQGLRSRDGKKSHKIGGKRVKVGGKKIKGAGYGGPLPDWGTRKGQKKN
jgi:hypothetical protein